MMMNSPRDLYKASDDPVARYTILLNYCTGDVERFCAELQRIKEIGKLIGYFLLRKHDLTDKSEH